MSRIEPEGLKNEKFPHTPNNLTQVPNFAGIYCIRCVVNDKKYVGQASHIKLRINSHLSKLRKGKHSSRELQKDWTNYGDEAFEIYVLCRCDRAELNNSEQYWINKLSANYNTMKITTNFTCSLQTREKLDYLPGLEEKFVPQKWHRWVYGAGRH